MLRDETIVGTSAGLWLERSAFSIRSCSLVGHVARPGDGDMTSLVIMSVFTFCTNGRVSV